MKNIFNPTREIEFKRKILSGNFSSVHRACSPFSHHNSTRQRGISLVGMNRYSNDTTSDVSKLESWVHAHLPCHKALLLSFWYNVTLIAIRSNADYRLQSHAEIIATHFFLFFFFFFCSEKKIIMIKLKHSKSGSSKL